MADGPGTRVHLMWLRDVSASQLMQNPTWMSTTAKPSKTIRKQSLKNCGALPIFPQSNSCTGFFNSTRSTCDRYHLNPFIERWRLDFEIFQLIAFLWKRHFLRNIFYQTNNSWKNAVPNASRGFPIQSLVVKPLCSAYWAAYCTGLIGTTTNKNKNIQSV